MLGLMTALALQTTGLVAPIDPLDAVVTAAPDAGTVLRYYPARAQRGGVEGRAVVECTVAKSGRVRNCVVVEETPRDAGFGAAAVRIFSSALVIAPMTKSGQPTVGRKYRTHMNFVLAP